MSNSIGIGKSKMSSSIGIGKPKMSLSIGIGKGIKSPIIYTVDILEGTSVLNCTQKVVTRACALRAS